MDLQICQYIIYKSTIYLLIKHISLIIIIIIFLWIATITYFNHVYMPSMECIITPEKSQDHCWKKKKICIICPDILVSNVNQDTRTNEHITPV